MHATGEIESRINEAKACRSIKLLKEDFLTDRQEVCRVCINQNPSQKHSWGKEI
jgi:hypothetical protein